LQVRFLPGPPYIEVHRQPEKKRQQET